MAHNHLPLTEEEWARTAAACKRHRRHDGSINKRQAAAELGITRSTLRARLRSMEKREAALAEPRGGEWTAPDLPESDLSAEDLITEAKKRFEKRFAAYQARDWMRFRVNIDGPFALAMVGDPHLADDGCHITALERDLMTIRDTPAMYGVGIGDYTNAWSGRLAHLYKFQSTTQSQAWKLAEWFFGQKKPNGQSMWWLLLKGNHDLWSAKHGTGDPLDWMARGSAVLQDWQARFVAVAANGAEVPIHAAHDFPGSSIYNPLHGPMRKGKFDPRALIYICGHRHNWGCLEIESPDIPGYVYWSARARGYKVLDDHAYQLGHIGQHYGGTITAVIDPDKTGPTMVRCFPDVEEAADFLSFKRRRV